MKLSISLISSVSNQVSVALAIALLVFGIVMCAVAAPPSLAQSLGTATSLSSTLYVDCAATSRGNGSAARPYWRITEALKKARALRRGSSGRITIRVAPGTCSGNFETQPTGQTTRPPELLPLVLNVPNLTLHGAGVMKYADGYPVGPRAGTATTVTVDTLHLGDIPNHGDLRRANHGWRSGRWRGHRRTGGRRRVQCVLTELDITRTQRTHHSQQCGDEHVARRHQRLRVQRPDRWQCCSRRVAGDAVRRRHN